MKELQVLTNALDAAIKKGVFNLQEAGNILQCINSIGQQLQSFGSPDLDLRDEKEELSQD